MAIRKKKVYKFSDEVMAKDGEKGQDADTSDDMDTM